MSKVNEYKEVPVNRKRKKLTQEDNMAPLMDHILDLRAVVIKSALVVVLWFIIIFATVSWWFPYVSKGANIVVLGPFEVIRFYLQTSVSISLGLSVPFICWFLWGFMKPGLVERETAFIKSSLPGMLFLFVAGLLFGYFVVHPISYFFLISLGEKNFDVIVTADEYMAFLLMTTIPFGLIFQLPVVILFLNYIGLLNAETMVKIRKYVYFGLLVVTALIMPPDVFTHLITLAPMIALYEVSIVLIRRREKKQQKKTQ